MQTFAPFKSVSDKILSLVNFGTGENNRKRWPKRRKGGRQGKESFAKEEENKGRDDVYWEWERKTEKGKKERKKGESAGNSWKRKNDENRRREKNWKVKTKTEEMEIKNRRKGV